MSTPSQAEDRPGDPVRLTIGPPQPRGPLDVTQHTVGVTAEELDELILRFSVMAAGSDRRPWGGHGSDMQRFYDVVRALRQLNRCELSVCKMTAADRICDHLGDDLTHSDPRQLTTPHMSTQFKAEDQPGIAVRKVSRLVLLRAMLLLLAIGGCWSFLDHYSARDGGGPWAEYGALTWITAGSLWVLSYVIQGSIHLARSLYRWGMSLMH